MLGPLHFSHGRSRLRYYTRLTAQAPFERQDKHSRISMQFRVFAEKLGIAAPRNGRRGLISAARTAGLQSGFSARHLQTI